jgi:hypothetical protein
MALLRQKFNGTCRVIIVDDHSEDQTAIVAARAAEVIGRRDALTVITGMQLPEGWTGKTLGSLAGAKENGGITLVPLGFSLSYESDYLTRLG